MSRGRDQRGPMERLVRISAMLSAHPQHGVPVDKLVAIAGFEQNDSGREQLKRELRHLERQGWQIERVSEEGTLATYRMVTTDNRLKVRLSPAEAAALQRAALLAKRSDLLEQLGLPREATDPPAPVDVTTTTDPAALDGVLEAVRSRALLHFHYKGTARVVHPQSVSQRNGSWYLRAVESGAEDVKTFLTERMSQVWRDDPGTARGFPHERHLELHPMRWELDEPVEVLLRVDRGYRDDVVRWLLEPLTEEPEELGEPEGGRLRMRYRVTNRSAFRSRLCELGPRVELLGPAAIRQELLDELARLAGGAKS